MWQATGGRIDITLSRLHVDAIIKASGVPYLLRHGGIRLREASATAPAEMLIDTAFAISHDDVRTALATLPRWAFGDLRPGHEFLAICLCGQRNQVVSAGLVSLLLATAIMLIALTIAAACDTTRI